MDHNEILAKNLKRLINEKYKTQKNMAEKLDIGENTISFWVNKKTLPELSTLINIAIDCDIPMTYFFESETAADSHEIIEPDLFNEVFALAYEFAGVNNLEINGTFFLGCYDLVVIEFNKDTSQSIESVFNNLKPFILKLVKKR